MRRSALLASLALLAACSDYDLSRLNGKSLPAEDTAGLPDGDTGASHPPDEETGSVKGRVCDLTGEGYVVGAEAWIAIDDDGDGAEDRRISDTTDADGYFLLEGVPLGDHVIHVEKGSFSTEIPVSLTDPGLLELTDEECLSPDDVTVAVITGYYDSIETILRDLGVDYDAIDGKTSRDYIDFLTDLDRMKEYDIIFFNCGISDGWITSGSKGEIGSNIKDYVEGGGSIYTSDWAHYFFEVAFPDAIDYYGDDDRVDDARIGQSGRLTADVLDANMKAILGSDTADLNYDLDAWVIPVSAKSTVDVLIQGDAPINWWYGGGTVTDAPLAVRFDKGSGTALYTTFHNESQNTIDMDALLEEIILSL